MAATETRVREVMTASPRSIAPDVPVLEAARIMRQEDVGSLPVCEGERLIGILTDRDIVVRVVAEEKDPREQQAAAVASRELVTVEPEQNLDEALRLMARHQIRRLPVVERDRRLVGVLAQADVARSADEHETGDL
jgi:CBS domain-containing protein